MSRINTFYSGSARSSWAVVSGRHTGCDGGNPYKPVYEVSLGRRRAVLRPRGEFPGKVTVHPSPESALRKWLAGSGEGPGDIALMLQLSPPEEWGADGKPVAMRSPFVRRVDPVYRHIECRKGEHYVGNQEGNVVKEHLRGLKSLRLVQPAYALDGEELEDHYAMFMDGDDLRRYNSIMDRRISDIRRGVHKPRQAT